MIWAEKLWCKWWLSNCGGSEYSDPILFCGHLVLHNEPKFKINFRNYFKRKYVRCFHFYEFLQKKIKESDCFEKRNYQINKSIKNGENLQLWYSFLYPGRSVITSVCWLVSNVSITLSKDSSNVMISDQTKSREDSLDFVTWALILISF